MTLSDDAARAIAKAAVADPAWQGQRFTVDKALAAVLPDGRTIAQALDDGETARSRLNLVLDMVYTLLMDDSDGYPHPQGAEAAAGLCAAYDDWHRMEGDE